MVLTQHRGDSFFCRAKQPEHINCKYNLAEDAPMAVSCSWALGDNPHLGPEL